MEPRVASHRGAILESPGGYCGAGEIDGLPCDQRQNRPKEQPGKNLLRNRRIRRRFSLPSGSQNGLGDAVLELSASASRHCEL